MAQHKWHKEIKAWADGEEVECQDKGCHDWYLVKSIYCFNDVDSIFRIKPQPQYLYAYFNYKELAVKWSVTGGHTAQGDYIGKIKLEVDDD